MARQLGLYIQDINKIHVVRGSILVAAAANTNALIWYDLSNPVGLGTGQLAPPFWHRGGGTGLVCATVEGTFQATVTVFLSSRTDGPPDATPISSFAVFDSTQNGPKIITIDRPFRWIASAVSGYTSGTVDAVDIYGVLP